MLGNVYFMNQLVLKKDMTIGFHFNFKKGDTIYYKESDYSDAFQEWTVNLFTKTEKEYKYLGTIRTSCMSIAISLNVA